MSGRIFVTGDCHSDFRKFNSSCFPVHSELDKDDYVIICGDFGAVWDNSKSDRYLQRWYNEKPWTTLFVDG